MPSESVPSVPAVRNPSATVPSFLAVLLLLLMTALAGGAALRESVTFDEVAHVGAGLSYWQKLDMRFNTEHPPLAKLLAGIPLAMRGTHADYNNAAWSQGGGFFTAYIGQWIFGEYVLNHWNDPARVLAWARFPMLLLTLALGWLIFRIGSRIGGPWGGLLSLSAYVTTPTFLAFGPLVLTDVAITLFSLLSIWTFADLWQEPTRKHTWLFALSVAGAFLSKFSAFILLFAFGAIAISTRWRAVIGQPDEKASARVWRRARWRATFKGMLLAALIVYVVYLVFSWNQGTESLWFLGGSSTLGPVRRLLMPPWLYLRGMVMLVLSGNRPAFILGQTHQHGIWYFFPVLFLLKSPLGFLGLLILALLLALVVRRYRSASSTISASYQLHWRALWISLITFSALCILSHLNVSLRHFSVPLVLFMLMLAPLPRLVQQLNQRVPKAAVAATALTAVLVLSAFTAVVRQYPYYFPFVNALTFGHPTYTLMSDSNVDWNQSLPEVRKFAEQHGVQAVKIDEYGWTRTAAVVPGSQLWDCQQPVAADAGQWVVVSSNMLVDIHNCSWLLQYPHQAIADGGMYAFQLPAVIPAAGTPGGPPATEDQRQFFGKTFYREPRVLFQEMVNDPTTMPGVVAEMGARFRAEAEKRKHK